MSEQKAFKKLICTISFILLLLIVFVFYLVSFVLCVSSRIQQSSSFGTPVQTNTLAICSIIFFSIFSISSIASCDKIKNILLKTIVILLMIFIFLFFIPVYEGGARDIGAGTPLEKTTYVSWGASSYINFSGLIYVRPSIIFVMTSLITLLSIIYLLSKKLKIISK